MLTSSPIPYPLTRILPPLSTAIGLVGLGGGIYGLVNPAGFSGSLGIPIRSRTSAGLPFVRFAGARNLGSGITVLALLWTGQPKAVGTLFMCGVVTSLVDAWVCVTERKEGKEGKEGRGKAWGHAVLGVGVGLLGWGLWVVGE